MAGPEKARHPSGGAARADEDHRIFPADFDEVFSARKRVFSIVAR